MRGFPGSLRCILETFLIISSWRLSSRDSSTSLENTLENTVTSTSTHEYCNVEKKFCLRFSSIHIV